MEILKLRLNVLAFFRIGFFHFFKAIAQVLHFLFQFGQYFFFHGVTGFILGFGNFIRQFAPFLLQLVGFRRIGEFLKLLPEMFHLSAQFPERTANFAQQFPKLKKPP